MFYISFRIEKLLELNKFAVQSIVICCRKRIHFTVCVLFIWKTNILPCLKIILDFMGMSLTANIFANKLNILCDLHDSLAVYENIIHSFIKYSMRVK